MDDDQEKPSVPAPADDRQQPSDEAPRSASSRPIGQRASSATEDEEERGGGPAPIDERRRLIDQRREARLPRPVPERRRRGREVARKPALPAAPSSPGPPAEAPEFAWVGNVQPEQVWMELKRARKRRLLLRLGIFCGLPTLFTFFYMLFVASPRYVSAFEITYQTYNPPQNLSSGLVTNLLGSTASNGALDISDILDEYIESAPLMEKLDQQLHLRQYYSSPKVDWLSRMNPHASLNTFLLYYNWYVSVSESNGYLNVEVQAFDPDFALKLAKAIVKDSDQMINQLTARPSEDEVNSAETELKRAEERVRNALLALTEFQDKHGDLNPPTSASQLGGIVGTIEGNLAAQRSQLAALVATAPQSPQIMVTKANIAGLEAQLTEERHRLANNGANDASVLKDGSKKPPYSKVLEQYSALQLEQQFAQNAYQSAQQGLEVAREDAAHQQNYLIDFAPPYKPDPQRLKFAIWYTVTVLTLTLVLFAIASLIGGAIRDQSTQ
jgi:capsular polysaccharide transport system permease protein